MAVRVCHAIDIASRNEQCLTCAFGKGKTTPKVAIYSLIISNSASDVKE
jgi:hypothetical protein